MNESRIIAVIPARGGSKGIPRKNIHHVAGLPLIAHSIRHARACEAINGVYVSTDDDAIAAVAHAEGAEIIQRPADLATDTATSESVLLHALDVHMIREGRDPDLVVFLQATSPLRGKREIDAALATLNEKKADSLFTASPIEGFLWRNDAQGLRSLSYDHRDRPRRQDAPDDLIENGSIYIFKPCVLRQNNNRLGGRIAVYRMKWLHSFQIDSPEDLVLMELLFRYVESRECDNS